MMGDECAIQLTTQERKFLMDVQERPTSFVVDRYCRLRLSARKGNEVQRVLIDRRLIESASISLRGGSGKILALTEEGRRALGLSPAPSQRDGRPVHRYWKARLAKHLRSCGYEVTEEFPVGGGKTIDLMAMRDGKRIAVEIETGNSDVEANLEKCRREGLQRVVVVATSVRVKRKLQAMRGEGLGSEVLTGTEATGKAW